MRRRITRGQIIEEERGNELQSAVFASMIVGQTDVRAQTGQCAKVKNIRSCVKLRLLA